MTEKTKKRLKFTGCAVVGTALTAALCTALYVLIHKPDNVSKPCYRSTHRADGREKLAFDTPERANYQSVKQFYRYGEICNSYRVGDKYYTGHSNKALIRSINLFKSNSYDKVS